MEDITCSELDNILSNQSTAFLCGNGFSINFDQDFGNIYDRLFNAHTLVLKKGKFNVNANYNFKRVFKENYSNVLRYVSNYKESNFISLFSDGIIFAESIISNKSLVDELNKQSYIHKLIFEKTELDLVKSIANVGRTKGYNYVNIEFWPILIYMYFSIIAVDCDKYIFPSANEFITLIKLGNINKNKIVPDSDDIHLFTLSNGFNIYYRMLFSSAILCNGKAIEFTNIKNTSSVNFKKVKKFLAKFQSLMTLNYDHILEYLTTKEVCHIHGKYVLNNKEYVFFQSLGIDLNSNTYISFSDILIGDYFVNKTFAGLINSSNNNPINKNILKISTSISSNMEQSSIEVVVIFGMNIDNDQHILRDIMICLSDRYSDNVKIIYCYFTEKDKELFSEQYEASITFRKDVNERIRNIDILYIKTQDILQEHFN